MKKVIIYISIILLAAYMTAAFFYTEKLSAEEKCLDVSISIAQRDSVNFVTPGFIANELALMKLNPEGKFIKEISTDSIERAFKGKDYVEDAQCYIAGSNTVRIEIEPIKPVIRLFEDGKSYYMNRNGKLIKTDARFFIDLPVVSGNFSGDFTPERLLPMVNYIESDPVLKNLVSAIEAKDSNNIFIIPNIAGHVVNMGTADSYESKFAKLMRMYREVMPVKGWDTYDTLNLKWDHQIVATKRRGGSRLNVAEYLPEEEEAAPDMETVTTNISTTKKAN